MRAIVWKSVDRYAGSKPWTYDLTKGSRRDGDYDIELIGRYLPTWREAFDAACAELRRRAES